jgi:hypothetical protein
VNVLLPALAVLSVLFGLAMAQLPLRAERLGHVGPASRVRLRALVPAAVILQLLLLSFNPLRWAPTPEDRKIGDALAAEIARLPGEVIVPTAPYLAVRAGKPPTAHLMAVMDVLRARGSQRVKRRLLADIHRRLRDPRCQAILLPGREVWFHEAPLPADFVYVGRAVELPPDADRACRMAEILPVHLFIRGSSPAAGR